ncbi:hypothetical protein [Acinetobacter sp.]|uniref:hypothetical protein n=1 Tax=Acinetobacter sp. TaxID=472 RepID=UPI00289F918A|nr:hypothetical protein [Acinetobacter sp.]
MNSSLKLFNQALFCSFIPFALFYHIPAQAGVDNYCEPSTTIQTNAYTSCNSLPALTPANDNQVNMLLLLSDLGLAKTNIEETKSTLWMTTYSKVPFEASNMLSASSNKTPNARKPHSMPALSYNEHCNSLEHGSAAFIQQVKTDNKLLTVEKDSLIRERKKIDECANKLALIQINPNWSSAARQYASYLNASISFYKTNFSTATKIYTVLTQVDSAWLKETSQYMLIRSSLNEVYQSGVGEYGDLDHDKINQKLLTNFFNNITQYFKLYPHGQYAASARGYLRRGFWLSGKHDLLVNEYVWQLNNPKSSVYNLELPNLAYEMDRHVFQSNHFNIRNLKDPFFLSIYDLMHMRKKQSDDEVVIPWNQLNAQKNYFKDQPELFQYLQANHLYYVQNKAQEALKYLPQNMPSSIGSYLQLSQLVLKGRILESHSSITAAQQYWENLLSISKTAEQRGVFELMLYPYYAKQQNLSQFIGQNTKIKQAYLQKQYLMDAANETSLMQIIKSSSATQDQKNVALYTVLNKSLAFQNFELFNQAYAVLPSNAAQYHSGENALEKFSNQPAFANFIWKGTNISNSIKCPDLFSLTKQLQGNPKDLTVKLCLGEYTRSPQAYEVVDLSYTHDNSLQNFKGSYFARGNTYKEIIKMNQKSELTAYALFRAIQCYAPSGINECQNQDVTKSVRKQWYDQIKRDYPETSWAKSLKYYW